MVRGNKESFLGHFASKGEFGLLMDVAGCNEVRDGKTVRVISKDTLRQMFEGTLFFDIAAELQQGRQRSP